MRIGRQLENNWMVIGRQEENIRKRFEKVGKNKRKIGTQNGTK